MKNDTECYDAYGNFGYPETCLMCDGKGIDYNETCLTCGGLGFRVYQKEKEE